MRIEIELLPGTEEHSEAIRAFVDTMIHKLYKNRHKGRWEYTIEDAQQKLHAEVSELGEAMKSNNLAWIMEEAADVGNFALIVSNIRLRQLMGDVPRQQVMAEALDLHLQRSCSHKWVPDFELNMNKCTKCGLLYKEELE